MCFFVWPGDIWRGEITGDFRAAQDRFDAGADIETLIGAKAQIGGVFGGEAAGDFAA